jgi:excisionase family DNA binding protein
MEMAYPATTDVNKATSLLTISEAAEFLHVHANTLRRWSDIGLLLSYRICERGDRRFFREDLIRFLADYMAYKDTTQVKGRNSKKES